MSSERLEQPPQKNEALEKITHQAEAIIVAAVDEAEIKLRVYRAAQSMGAARFALALGESMSASAMKALEDFKREKMHEAFGYTRFDDYLDHHPEAPMTKNQFYERRGVWKAEGDALFNVMTSLGISIVARKKLKGEIVATDTEIRIGSTTVSLSDTHAVRLLFEQTIERLEVSERTNERGKKENKVLKRKLDERPTKDAEDEDLTPYNKLMLKAQSGLARLAMHVRTLPKAERLALREGIFNRLTPQWDDINAACLYQTHAPDDKDFGIADTLTADELDALEQEM